jgi:formylglycine-generating enzyme
MGAAGPPTAGVAPHPGVVAPEPRSPEAEPPAEPNGAEPDPPPPIRAPDGTAMVPCGRAPLGMACVEGGPFVRGTDDGPANARPAARVWVQTFYMDLHEVTYAEYKACQQAKQCPRGGPLYNDFSRPRQPIVGPTWHGAVAYCAWRGKHLPTEAQWEKAARGPDGALHPWGDEPATCERAVIKDHRGRSCGVRKRKEAPEKGRTFEVGSRPAGVYGLHDMIGNAWEWVADWAAPSYAQCGDACLGTDPRGPCDGADACPGYTQKVVRGGSWYWDRTHATGVVRRFHVPDNDPFHHFGFRCAASVEQAEALSEAEPMPETSETSEASEPRAGPGPQGRAPDGP